MKNLLRVIVLSVFASFNMAAQCKDISTTSVIDYLNREIKPSLDLKLDKDDGFLAIKGQRLNLQLPEVSHDRGIKRTWTYSFYNIRRVDNNFFYDSNKNLIALDVKFESDDSELKGRCPGCPKSKDLRAPDINWTSVQILRLYLKPIVYNNSISFEVDDIKFIGDFKANGLQSLLRDEVVGKSLNQLKIELQKVFQNGQTQRLFNDAIKPLLQAKNISNVRSVSLASSSLRACK
ncbi:hypothetical protein [Yeosuana marina]|uniref:hypothetical protein n=1 Tax=Yeosuana marina TaxID=1565536 RepID=UPI0030C89EB8